MCHPYYKETVLFCELSLCERLAIVQVQNCIEKVQICIIPILNGIENIQMYSFPIKNCVENVQMCSFPIHNFIENVVPSRGLI